MDTGFIYEKKKSSDRLHNIPCWLYITFHKTFLLEHSKLKLINQPTLLFPPKILQDQTDEDVKSFL